MSLCPFEHKIEKGRIELILPLKAANEANSSEHWTKKQKRHRLQKRSVFYFMANVKKLIKMPCTITFVRYAPKFLDAHDNLRMSFKYILDGVTACITGDYRAGLADNNPGFTFQYDQVKDAKYKIKIIFEFQDE